MTRIAALGRSGTPAANPPHMRAGAPHFALAPPPPPQAGAIAPLGLTGLIALQDDDAPSRRDRAARHGGKHTLEALGLMQAALLGGEQASALSALSDAVDRMVEPADPTLLAIISAIRLRARIELVRHERI